jgi:hypothetical protein
VAIARQQHGRHIFPATNKRATIEEFLKAVVSVQSAPRLYNEDTIRIISVMTYSCPTWECAVDAHLLKLQCLQNRVLRAVGYLDTCTPVHELRVALKIPYVYDCITKLCRTQAEVFLNRVNPNVHGIGQGEARHRKYKRHQLGGCQACDHSAD